MIKVTMVPREYVPQIWKDVKGHLAKAAEYTYGRYEVDDIFDAIMDYDHILWIAYDGDNIKGAVVTNFMNYPRKKYVGMVFCGGENLVEWKDPMLKMLQHWARDSNCDGVEFTGRPGWLKIFKNDGNRAMWHTCELPAAEVGLGERNG